MGKSIGRLPHLCGALLFAATLSLLAQSAAVSLKNFFDIDINNLFILGSLLGFIIGWIVTPSLIRQSKSELAALTSEQLAGVVVGALGGTLLAALLAIPLGRLPDPLGQFAPLAIGTIILYLSIITLRERPHDLMGWVAVMRPKQVTVSSGT